METKTYRYTVEGTNGDASSYRTQGTFETPEFSKTFDMAMRASFLDLTQGRAEFGKPGQGGCRGPYKIRKIIIEEVES